jgi:alkanesulfonate monooxygenase SsuD/methylene tetrahydromethanopterin reductase-like flavin-dependent oxidoreductase (luciferase family)
VGARARGVGIPLPQVGPRLDALEEQLQLVRRYWEPGPFSFEGEHYSAKEIDAQPKPIQQPRPPLILGGRGGPRSLRLAARYADEYNTVMMSGEELANVRQRLDQACEAEGRDPTGLPLSMMTGWLVAADHEELRDRAARLSEWKGGDGDGGAFLADLRKGTIAGTVPEALDQLNELKQAGLTRLMAQHLLHRDLDAIELIGRSINPTLAR